jgi:hypothetical protein
VTQVQFGEALMIICEPDHTHCYTTCDCDAGCRRDVRTFYFLRSELQFDTRVRGTLLTVWVSR